MSAKLEAKLVTVTPEIAMHWLAKNTGNRSVTQARVVQYAADIRHGDWQVNGESIKIAANGRVLDGQHRLLAVLEADRPMTTLVISGLPEDAQETMDQGRARTFGDVLKLRGEHDYYVLGAAVRIVALFERDGVPFKGPGAAQPSIKEMARTLERNPEIRASVAAARRAYAWFLNVSQLSALHYLFAVACQEDADDFVHRLGSGENLTANHPIHVLRERLIRDANDSVRQVNGTVLMAITIKAWNAYRRGEEIERIGFVPGGARAERFPAIDGLASVPESGGE